MATDSNKLLLTTDENTILITARFYDNMDEYQDGVKDDYYYDIDMIVKKDITLDKLMEAIKYGLLKRTGVTKGDGKSSHEITIDEKKRDINIEPYNPNVEESKDVIFSKCWKIFDDCYRFYEDPTKIHEVDSEHSYRVGLLSYNFRCFEENELLSINAEQQTWLDKKVHGEKKLEDIGFMTSSVICFDGTAHHESFGLYDREKLIKPFDEQVPLYNISDRPLFDLSDSTINIIPPTDMPKKGKQDLVSTLLSPILMMGATTVARFFAQGTQSANLWSYFAMYLPMVIVSGAMGVFNWSKNNKEYRETLSKWRTEYENYINKLIKDIKSKQEKDKEKLQVIYPPKLGSSKSLTHKALSIDGDIFSRGQEHPDFLSVRIGLSSGNSKLVPSLFEISGEKKDVVFTETRYKNIEGLSNSPFTILLGNEVDNDSRDRYLIDLPADISKKYSYLSGAPVLVNIKECGALGVLFPEEMDFTRFVDNIILDLCFYQSPDDVQFIMFCPEEANWRKKQDFIEKYKHLPHFRNLLGDVSPFAFNGNDANTILNKSSKGSGVCSRFMLK